MPQEFACQPEQTTIIKSGAIITDRRLDRIDEKDPRSRNFSIADMMPYRKDIRPRSYTWAPGPTLNQGFEGACVGFAWAHELAARPVQVTGLTAVFAREQIYYAAQKLDQYPGGAYPGALPFIEGTSVLAGAKAVKALGYISEYCWAFNLWDLVLAVGYRGPALFGCNWYADMHIPNEDCFVSPTGKLRGGHCVVLISVKIRRDKQGKVSTDNSYFTFQNSWGPEWGQGGFGKIRLKDMEDLWDGAETCIPVTRHRLPVTERKAN
jgi:hypothetical protein